MEYHKDKDGSLIIEGIKPGNLITGKPLSWDELRRLVIITTRFTVGRKIESSSLRELVDELIVFLKNCPESDNAKNDNRDILVLPELLRQDNKQHDPERVTAYHEAAHGLVMTSFGLLPKWTSLITGRGELGFNSREFDVGYDVGIQWRTGCKEFILMTLFGGICGGAAYAGEYFWDQSISDLKKAFRYKVGISELLRIWIKTNDFVIKHYDLLEKAAERLYRDKILGSEYWEEEILLFNT